MKRKKLYSMLALGLAMSLTVSVPVSAAVSPTTETTTDPATGEVTTVDKVGDKESGGDYSETTKVTDKDGNFVSATVDKVETDSANGNKTATKAELDENDNVVKSTATTTNADGKVVAVVTVDADVSDEVAKWKEDESTAKPIREIESPTISVEVKELEGKAKETAEKEAMGMFEKIDPSNVKPGTSGVDLSVTPVEAKYYAVAEQAATQMKDQIVEKIGANKITEIPKVLAALNIAVDNYEAGKKYDISIPMTDENEKFDPDNFDYFVLHCKSDGTWETVPARIMGDNIVIATFSEFSPVFIVRTEKMVIPPASTGNGSEDGGDEENNEDNGNSAAVSAGIAKVVGTTPAGSATPANPAVSPKTGE